MEFHVAGERYMCLLLKTRRYNSWSHEECVFTTLLEILCSSLCYI